MKDLALTSKLGVSIMRFLEVSDDDIMVMHCIIMSYLNIPLVHDQAMNILDLSSLVEPEMP